MSRDQGKQSRAVPGWAIQGQASEIPEEIPAGRAICPSSPLARRSPSSPPPPACSGEGDDNSGAIGVLAGVVSAQSGAHAGDGGLGEDGDLGGGRPAGALVGDLRGESSSRRVSLCRCGLWVLPFQSDAGDLSTLVPNNSPRIARRACQRTGPTMGGPTARWLYRHQKALGRWCC